MALVNLNMRIDEELKREMDLVCSEMGLSMTAAFTIFAKTVVRERCIPFEVAAGAPSEKNEMLSRLQCYRNLLDDCVYKHNLENDIKQNTSQASRNDFDWDDPENIKKLLSLMKEKI